METADHNPTDEQDRVRDRTGELIGGRWRLQRLLGTGAMAAVYEAVDAIGLRAAVKLLHDDVAGLADVRRRFGREARVSASLEHPHIVRVLDQDTETPETAYIAMELLEGETLAEQARREGTLLPDQVLGYLDQALAALEQAHAAGIVHRDLKPSNLWVQPDGTLKVLDFGVARLTDPGATATRTQLGLALGTISYMAPEQARGQHDDVDGRTDLFALGAILFRLVSGRPLHDAGTQTQMLAAMATRAAPPFSLVCPTQSAALAALVDTSLSFSREGRYPDAGTMRQDVRALLGGQAPPYATSLQAERQQATVAPGHLAAAAPLGLEPTALPASFAGAGVGDELAALTGQLVADRYRVQELLGSGGMGAVYRAEHVHMKKTVAFKVLHREMTCLPEVVARFEREAVAAGRIEHPNVAAATDFGRLEDGAFYLVLEFVQGRSLRKVLDVEGRLSPARAVGIVQQIAGALAAAHETGIVHRDLKPDNVMLVDRQPEPELVKVLDFGIAKLMADEASDKPALTQIGSVFGTPEYMSPEQAMGTKVDHRSDLYSLGIILYEMLSGRTPFQSAETVAVLARQLTEAPQPLGSEVDPALAALVVRLLEKRPEHRPQTAAELLATLPAPDRLPAPTMAQRRARLAARLRERSRALWAKARLRIPALARPLTIAGRTVPGWVLLAAGVGALATGLVVVLLVASLTGETEERPVAAARALPTLVLPASEPPASKDDEQELRQALSRIEELPVYKRREQDWVDLARGHARLRQWPESVAAYRAVLSIRTSYRKDRQLLADLRRAAEAPETYKLVVNLCETRLGKAGVDLLYDLWLATRSVREKSAIAELALKKLEILSRRASPATRVAVELQTTTKCAALQKILPRAVTHADQRAVEVLEKLTKKTGCGDDRTQDCYWCLRDSDDLQQALQAARTRDVPELGAAFD